MGEGGEGSSAGGRKALRLFLLDAFTVPGLEVFLDEHGHGDVHREARKGDGDNFYVYDVVARLGKHGRITPELFKALGDERPARAPEIAAIAAVMLGPGNEGDGASASAEGDAESGEETRAHEDDAALLRALDERAREARPSLEPLTLPRVPRDELVRRYVGVVQEVLAGERTHAIAALLGRAGSGKTTLLGQLHDSLATQGLSSVILRCNDLRPDDLPSLKALDLALGRLASGRDLGLVEAVRRARCAGASCVVLLDTVDLVLDGRTVVDVIRLLGKVAAVGGVVVLTCRDHEFREYVDSRDDHLRDVLRQVDRFELPPFTDAEVLVAGAAFFRSRHVDLPAPAPELFAVGLLRASADRRSLDQIVRSPLLLSMLCDLYGEREQVPPDLTVSELYATYWDRKVTRSRRDPDGRWGAPKRSLCYSLAKSCFNLASATLLESFDEDALRASLHIDAWDKAMADLLSEGVLERASGRLRFFHQTLLEYALARWLMTPEAMAARQALLEQVRRRDASGAQGQLWFILRQFLVVCDEGDHRLFREALDLRSIVAFRALAFSMAARPGGDDVAASADLLHAARGGGPEHFLILAEALDAAPEVDGRARWTLTLEMLKHEDPRVTTRGAEIAGALLARGATSPERLSEALSAIPEGERWTSVSGKIIERITARDGLSSALLARLRDAYPRLGVNAREAVVRVHAGAIAVEVQQAMWKVLIEHPELKIVGQPYVTAIVASLIAAGPLLDPWGPRPEWLDRAGEMDRRRWVELLSRAVGRSLAAPGSALAEVVIALVERGGKGSWLDLAEALLELIRAGGGARLLAVLVSRVGPDAPPERMRRLTGILEALASASDVEVDPIVSLTERAFEVMPDELVSCLVAAAGRSERAWAAVLRGFSRLREHRQIAVVQKLLSMELRYRADIARIWPGAPGFDHVGLSCRLALSRVDDDQAMEARTVDELIAAALSGPDRVSLAAAVMLRQHARDFARFPSERLVQLAGSPRIGVRLHAVEAFRSRLRGSDDLVAQDVVAFATRLGSEDAPPVLTELLTLTTELFRSRPDLPRALAVLAFDIMARIAPRTSFDPGTLREGLRALKAIAQRGGPLEAEGVAAVEECIRRIDLSRVRDGESLGLSLLASASDSDPRLLDRLLDQLLVLPERNARAVLYATARRRGWASPEIARIERLPDLPGWARDFIVEGRGS